MVVIAEYWNHEKGWAFYLSRVASCYVKRQRFVCFCAIRIYKRSEDESGGDSQNEVARCESNTEKRGAVVGQVDEQHQIGVSETGEIIVRKLQCVRIVHIS
uniref:Uncharacterized protein n=1 Tax=Magallana gigas TaxID=29159 RepID=A0A8W8JKL6_MAGGI